MAKKIGRERVIDVINCTNFKSLADLEKINDLCDCYFEAHILTFNDFDYLITLAREKYEQSLLNV